MTVRALVIGVGNPYRRDDGVGAVVVQRLRDEAVVGLDAVEASGEPAALLDEWSGRDLAIVVDAVRSGGSPGHLHRWTHEHGHWDAAPQLDGVSSHGLGVGDAVELGRLLDRLPRRLVVLGVEAGDVGDGLGLSDPVARAVDVVVDEVRRTVTR